MRSARTYHGGAAYRALTEDTTFNLLVARVWTVAASAGNPTFMLSDATRLKVGHRVLILNIGANSFPIETAAGGAVATLAAGDAIALTLMANATAAGAWRGTVRALGGSTAALRVLDLLVVGGTGTTTTTSRYGVAAGTWTAGAACPNGHVEGAASRIGGRVMVTGTFPLGAGALRNDEFTEAGAWTNRADCQFQAGRTMAAAVRGRHLVFGGDAATNVAAYEANAWSARSVLPIAKTRGVAVGVGGKAVIVSGEPVATPNLLYDEAGDFFSTIAYQPTTSRRSIAGFGINGKVNVVGGRRDSPLTRYDVNEEYDPTTDAWTNRAPLSLGARYGGAGIGANGVGVYAGGRDNADAAAAGVASFRFNAWTALTALPAARAEIDNQGAAL